MAALSIDELNVPEKNHKNLGKISYEEYFGEMELPDEEKKERMVLAGRLEAVFVSLFAELDGSDGDMDAAYEEACNSYTEIVNEFISKEVTPSALLAHVSAAVLAVIKVVNDNADSDDPWYLSDERATYIAANEANYAGNYREQIEMVKQGYKFKTWKTMADKRVRHTHKVLDRKTLNIFEPFEVGNSLMMFPKDTSLDAESCEIANCRCVVKYSK